MRAFLLLVVVAVSFVDWAFAQERPNVVLILGDDPAWSDFSCMSVGPVATPNIDRLAREGAFFPKGYVPTSLCRPSLASLVTGRYPHEHGITGNDPPKAERAALAARIKRFPTLPRELAKLGLSLIHISEPTRPY